MQSITTVTKATSTPGDIRLTVYNAWVDEWLASSIADVTSSTPALSLGDISHLFKDENLSQLLQPEKLRDVVRAVRQQIALKQVTLGGTIPPSCPETDVLSESYDPRVGCSCSGGSRDVDVPGVKKDLHLWRKSECLAIRRMGGAAETVIAKQDEWHSEGIFTVDTLRDAVTELICSSHDIQPVPDTCCGPGSSDLIPPIQAPDRRPDHRNDSDMTVYKEMFPTLEEIKLCADAKYFFAIACGGSLSSEGLVRAVADAGNDILIGDYCEAASEETLSLLQRVGAAAVAFLKLCSLAGVVTAHQFDNLVAFIVQFRVLGFYRGHSRPRIPDGFRGSYSTGLLGHRYIDIGIWVGVMSASLGTGESLSSHEYFELAEICTLINDLVDLRGDTMRKLRENPILRGVRGCVCNYLNSCLTKCLEIACAIIEQSQLGGLVILGFCNWAAMSSHHKVYELVHGVEEVRKYPTCEYDSVKDNTLYNRLLKALRRYGSLDAEAPHVFMKRAMMDQLYHSKRAKPATHLAWMADIARSLLEPTTLRKIIDVVHFEWKGSTGDQDYCP